MWQPSEADREWLRGLVTGLADGGIWAAPMGFIYRKETEELPYGLTQPVLRLVEICADSLDAWMRVSDTIERCAAVGRQIGVEVETKAQTIIANLAR